jgi:hypothetical protein
LTGRRRKRGESAIATSTSLVAFGGTIITSIDPPFLDVEIALRMRESGNIEVGPKVPIGEVQASDREPLLYFRSQLLTF